MKCKKCKQEVPLTMMRCPHCHRKLYRKRDFFYAHKSSIAWLYMIFYFMFGLLLPQSIAWKGHFTTALQVVILLTLLGMGINIVLLQYVKKEAHYHKMEICLLRWMLVVYVMLGFFYYDMMEKLIAVIRLSI